MRTASKDYRYIIPLLVTVLFLIYRVYNAKFDAVNSPYTVLGLDDSASKADVKKIYKRLIRKYDPDFQEDKEACTKKLYDINKAYNQISQGISIKSSLDDETVAIPQFVIDRKYSLIFFYLMFLVAFVYVGVKLWRRSVKCNVYGVDYRTVDIFYNKIEGVIARENDCIVRNIIYLMGESIEFEKASGKVNKWVKLELSKMGNKEENNERAIMQLNEEKSKISEAPKAVTHRRVQHKKANMMGHKSASRDPIKKYIKHCIEHNYAYPIRDGPMGYYILMDHLFRTNIFRDADRKKIAEQSLGMVSVMKRIAVAKNMHEILNSLFMLQRMITQAVFEPSYWALQYPSMTFEDVLLKRKVMADSFVMLPNIKIVKMTSYIDMPNANNCMDSSDEELEGTELISPKYNKIPVITVKAILERDSHDKSTSDDVFIVKTKGETDLDVVNAMGKLRNTMVHSPFLQRDSALVWEAIFTFNSEVRRTFSFSDFEGTKELIFEMDSEKGRLELEVKNGQYFGCDARSEIQIENQ